MIPGSSVLITNLKPMWSSSEIKQLLATSGSEVKVLKRENVSTVSDDEKKIRFETLGNIRKGIGREREMNRDGDMANGINASTSTTSNDSFRSVVPEESSLTTNEKGFAQPNSNTPSSDGAESTLVSGDSNSVAFSIDVTKLSDTQKTALRVAGIEGDSLKITNGMVACMEAKIGTEQMVVIKNGASPSITQGLALATCYSSN